MRSVGLSRKVMQKRKTDEDPSRSPEAFKSPRVELVEDVKEPPLLVTAVSEDQKIGNTSEVVDLKGKLLESPLKSKDPNEDDFDDDYPLSPIVGRRYDSEDDAEKTNKGLNEAPIEDLGLSEVPIEDLAEPITTWKADDFKDPTVLQLPHINPALPIEAQIGRIGFTTASGKPVFVSEAALKKAKCLFQETEVEEEIPIPSAAAGTSEMSQEVMDCIQAFLNDDDEVF